MDADKDLSKESYQISDHYREDPFIQFLKKFIHFTVKVLALIMTIIIVWGVVDVSWVLYNRLLKPPIFILNISDILETFGAFMAVMIAIEIFSNITVYLRDDVIHVEIVLATALMAISRKVIILDFKDKSISPEYLLGMAAIIIALGITYWLLVKRTHH